MILLRDHDKHAVFFPFLFLNMQPCTCNISWSKLELLIAFSRSHMTHISQIYIGNEGQLTWGPKYQVPTFEPQETIEYGNLM
jgi:hypothetical protein